MSSFVDGNMLYLSLLNNALTIKVLIHFSLVYAICHWISARIIDSFKCSRYQKYFELFQLLSSSRKA